MHMLSLAVDLHIAGERAEWSLMVVTDASKHHLLGGSVRILQEILEPRYKEF